MSEHKMANSNCVFHNAIKKYGWIHFSFEILYSTKNATEAFEAEKTFIKEHNTFFRNGKGYNMTFGGEGYARLNLPPWNKGIARSEREKQKISLSKIGKKQSKETIEKRVSKTKGLKRSPETINKMSNEWLIIFPNGDEKQIINLQKFCRENNLTLSCMINVANGNRKHHKRYSCKRTSLGSCSRIL